MTTTTTTTTMPRLLLLAATAAALLGARSALAFSGGAPTCFRFDSACSSMCPNKVQHATAPMEGHIITMTGGGKYTPGTALQVVVTVPSSDTISGYVVHAHKAGMNDVYVGEVTAVVDTAGTPKMGAPCAGAATHSTSGRGSRTSVELTWQPPVVGTGDVVVEVLYVVGGYMSCTWVSHTFALAEDSMGMAPSPTPPPPTPAPTAFVAVCGTENVPATYVNTGSTVLAVRPDIEARLSWTIDCMAGTIDVTMSAKWDSWLAVGFHIGESYTGGMAGGDIIQMRLTADNSGAECYDVHAVRDGLPVPDSKTECSVVASSFTGGVTSITVRRPLISTDTDSNSFKAGDKVWVMNAAGPQGNRQWEAQHAIRESVQGTVNFFTSTAVVLESDDTKQAWRAVHGALMLIAWMVSGVAATVLARFLKDLGPLWFKVHRALGTSTVVVGLVGFAIIVATSLPRYVDFDPAPRNKLFTAHSLLGTIITALSIVQPILGALADKCWSPDREKTPVCPDMLHWWLGRSLVFMAFVNMAMGISLFDNTGTGIPVGALALYFIWCIVSIGIQLYGQATLGAVSHNGDAYAAALKKRRDKDVVRGRVIVVVYFMMGMLVSVVIVGIANPVKYSVNSASGIAALVLLLTVIAFCIQGLALAFCKRATIVEDVKSFTPEYVPPVVEYQTYSCDVCGNVYMIPEHVDIHKRLRHGAGMTTMA